jgi:hypothetical protein
MSDHKTHWMKNLEQAIAGIGPETKAVCLMAMQNDGEVMAFRFGQSTDLIFMMSTSLAHENLTAIGGLQNIQNSHSAQQVVERIVKKGGQE